MDCRGRQPKLILVLAKAAISLPVNSLLPGCRFHSGPFEPEASHQLLSTHMASQNYVSTQLTHFVGRGLKTAEEQYTLVLEILRTGWLRPSYRGEFGAGTTMRTDPKKPLASNECVRAAALCFCDIPFDDLAIHMAKYSSFGLAFSKKFMLAQGASPVFYVAKNAAAPASPGIGPRTLGEKFQCLRDDLAGVCAKMHEYAYRNAPAATSALQFTCKLSPPGTPAELQILGKLNAFVSDLDQMVFAHLKSFNGLLSDDHIDNFYMEREWRKMDGLAFRPENVERIIVPIGFESRLRREFSQYTGLISAGHQR